MRTVLSSPVAAFLASLSRRHFSKRASCSSFSTVRGGGKWCGKEGGMDGRLGDGYCDVRGTLLGFDVFF